MLRCVIAVLALGFLAFSLPARAQLQVSAQTERTTYLLYERLDLVVTLQNTSDSDIILNNDEGHSWLSFLVSKKNHLPVRPDHKSGFESFTLKQGESKTLRVNLTPLFSFRETGDYIVSAVIDLPGQSGQLISDVVPFSIIEGRKVWSAQRPVDGSLRTYSLIRFAPQPDRTALYLRVEDPDQNIVYANLALGEIVAYVDPDVQFDPQGNLHVLQPIAMGTYLYSRADGDGKIVRQQIFKTYQQIPPRLAKVEDGSVLVNGGLSVDPNVPREKLSDAQGPQKAASASRGSGSETTMGSSSTP